MNVCMQCMIVVSIFVALEMRWSYCSVGRGDGDGREWRGLN